MAGQNIAVADTVEQNEDVGVRRVRSLPRSEIDAAILPALLPIFHDTTFENGLLVVRLADDSNSHQIEQNRRSAGLSIFHGIETIGLSVVGLSHSMVYEQQLAMSSSANIEAPRQHTDPAATKNPSQPQQSYTYYHAGPLFTLAELHTNVVLSQAINRISTGKFKALLPQDIEPRGAVTPHAIRDKDIRALLSCDLALITYDGTELDSGTVVEYMIAKMADVPCVILRSDFRGAGDQPGGEPWNLMTSHWPRTRGVVVDALVEYRKALSGMARDDEGSGRAGDGPAGASMIGSVAERCVEAMEQVIQIPARMPKELRSQVYQWIGLMTGYAEGDDVQDISDMVNLLAAKEEKGMFDK